MANYIVSDTQLTAIADAIRSKREIDDLLEFPNEFTSAINDIEIGDIFDTISSSQAISITNAAAAPLTNLVVNFEPVQDLHGYSKPWVGGYGKNLIPVPYLSTADTYSDVAITIDEFGVLTLNGTASANVYFNLIGTAQPLSIGAGNYILHGIGTKNAIIIINKNGEYWTETKDTDLSLTLSETTDISMYIRASSGAVFSNFKIYPMFEKGETASNWEPYSNVCPILGYTNIDLVRTGKNILNPDLYGQELPKETRKVTFSKVSDGVYHVQGTVEGGTAYYNISDTGSNPSLAMPIYNLIGKPLFISVIGDNNINVYLGYYKASGGFTNLTNGSILPSDAIGLRCYISILEGVTIDADFSVQLEIGSSATTYEFYQGSDYTVSLPNPPTTVYKGTLDLLSGILTVTHVKWSPDPTVTPTGITDMTKNGVSTGYTRCAYAASAVRPTITAKSFSGDGSNMGWYSHGTYSNPYNEGFSHGYVSPSGPAYFWFPCAASGDTIKAFVASQATAGTPIELVYEIAEPIEYQLTPQQITMLQGNNTILSSHKITLTYLNLHGNNLINTIGFVEGGAY